MDEQKIIKELTGFEPSTLLLVAEMEELMKEFRSKLNDIIVRFYEKGYDRAIQKLLEMLEKEGIKVDRT